MATPLREAPVEGQRIIIEEKKTREGKFSIVLTYLSMALSLVFGSGCVSSLVMMSEVWEGTLTPASMNTTAAVAET